MRQPPEEYYCTNCGGPNITVEAYCVWDNVEQKFAHFETADEGYDYCADCEDQAHGDFRPITDVKTLAQIAIEREEAREKALVEAKAGLKQKLEPFGIVVSKKEESNEARA
ncbi:hypothetical protein OAF44_03595 [Akkermansiaceae bacterium]|nr:hypothetical protein [Akkermansiaceae bacterium]